MRSYEISNSDSNEIEKALIVVHRDQEKKSWNPVKLQTPLRIVWAVTQAQGTIDNGGLQYFFENDWPNTPPYSVFSDALRVIGATEAAKLIDNAVALFPVKCPETNLEMRRNFMEASEKEEMRQSPFYEISLRLLDVGGETMTALAAYIRQHQGHFLTSI